MSRNGPPDPGRKIPGIAKTRPHIPSVRENASKNYAENGVLTTDINGQRLSREPGSRIPVFVTGFHFPNKWKPRLKIALINTHQPRGK